MKLCRSLRYAIGQLQHEAFRCMNKVKEGGDKSVCLLPNQAYILRKLKAFKLFAGFHQQGAKVGHADEAGGSALRLGQKLALRIVNGDFRIFAGLTETGG